MIATQIGIVLCRVGAAVLVVQAIRLLGYTLPGFLSYPGGSSSGLWIFVLMALIPVLAAVGLWVFADRICAIPTSLTADSENGSLGNTDFLLVGTSLIGIYLLIAAVVDGVNVEVLAWSQPDIGTDNRSMLEQQEAQRRASRASYAIQFVIAISLILGRGRISRLISKVRYAGTNVQ